MDQWSLSKYGTTTMFLEFEQCLKYLVPHHFVPPPLWTSSCSTLKGCAFNKRYMSLSVMTFYTKVWINMKSNHLLDMGVSKSMRCFISLKKMSISILLKPLKKKCNLMRLELCHFSIHLTTCQPCNGNKKQYTNHVTVTSCKFGTQD